MTINKHLSFIMTSIISILSPIFIFCLCASSFFIFNINAFQGFALVSSSAECPPAIVKAVLYLGADVHANDDEALFAAVLKGRPENVKVLLDHGAGSKRTGDSFLSTALTNGNVDIAKILIERLDIKFECSRVWMLEAKAWNKESVKFITDQLKGVPYECAPKVKK
jgi:hypothetical protein